MAELRVDVLEKNIEVLREGGPCAHQEDGEREEVTSLCPREEIRKARTFTNESPGRTPTGLAS